MRIGTWNLEGKHSPAHLALLEAQRCDVWLLTEVSEQLDAAGWHTATTAPDMTPGRSWAAVWSRRPVQSSSLPHPASCAAVVDGTTFISTVLPWRSCGSAAPWRGESHAERTRNALLDLRDGSLDRPVVWGGDWNHSLSGREYAGSDDGRVAVQEAIRHWGLQVPTEHLLHQLPDVLSIDHVAVPTGWTAVGQRVPVGELSDHDAYVVEVTVR